MGSKPMAVQLSSDTKHPKLVRSETMTAQMDEIFQSIARRAYEIFESNGRLFGNDLNDWFEAEQELLHPVHVNISETPDALEVKAEVPGFSERELEISVKAGQLTISGQHESSKEEKKGKTVYSEHCANEILRTVELPASVDSDKVTATLKDGVLALTLPKAAKASTVKVQPKAA
jgi:HSP20 family molecular chaperone IbpA